MLSKIIDELASDDDLTKPLLKTLVFARRIGNDDLATWVTRELNGYPDVESLPAYRSARTTVSGVLKQNGRLTGQVALPLSCFTEKIADMLMKKRFTESITMLEEIAKNNGENKYIGKDFAADMLSYLSQQAKENGCNFSVISCRQLVAISEISSINTNIRTSLLELLLNIEKDYPQVEASEVDAEVKSEINERVSIMMGNIYNINTNGSDTKINTGDGNHLS